MIGPAMIAHARRAQLLPLFCLLLCAWPLRGKCESIRSYKLIKLHNGINTADFGGGAGKALLVMAHRENFNAHSFEVTTVYITLKSGDDKVLQIVPVEIAPGKYELQVYGKRTRTSTDGFREAVAQRHAIDTKENRQHLPQNRRRRALNEIEQRDHAEFLSRY